MAKKEEKKTEEQKTEALTTTGTKALANLPDYGDDYGDGFENQDQSDIVMPMLVVLQANSPIVVEQKIKDARAGSIFNTVTQEIYNEVYFVPAYTDTKYCKWRPRGDGGGFRGQLEPEHPKVLKALREAVKFGKNTIREKTIDKNNNEIEENLELVETKYVYGVICKGEEAIGPMVLGCTSSKIKPFKAWNTKISTFRVDSPSGEKKPAPIYAHLTLLTTEFTKNNAGQPFYNIVLKPAIEGDVEKSLLAPDDDRFRAAKEMCAFVRSGQAKVDYEKERAGGGEEDGGGRNSEGVAHF